VKGRLPKPTALKEILGNPGHRPLAENEPQPEGEVLCPRFLKGRAKRLWSRYAPPLIACAVLKATDAHTLAAWCCLTAQFETDAECMTSSRIAQMRALAASLGLDPSSRSRLNVKPPSTGPLSRAEQYFAWSDGDEAKGWSQ
jgi:phage terminase small subunit